MSRADRFDRADFELAVRPQSPAAPSAPSSAAPAPQEPEPAAQSQKPIWPIADLHRQSVGSSVMPNRHGRAHKGVDIHAPAGAEVLASVGGRVLRVVDGRKSKRPMLRRAGLFVDVRGNDSLIYRYLHLGEARAIPGAIIQQGVVVGLVAAAHTSGLGDWTHLHFEIRSSDYDSATKDYGSPINPLRLLPALNV